MEHSTILGIEGGASTTHVEEIDGRGTSLCKLETGPCNLRLQSDASLAGTWRGIAARLQRPPAAIGVFLAGCKTSRDRARTKRLITDVWPDVPIALGHDLAAAFAAVFGSADGFILVCGTGVGIYARYRGRELTLGGHGHVVGDAGSGYWIAHAALRTIFRFHDNTGRNGLLGQQVLCALGLNTLDELVEWSVSASKEEIAGLCPIVFEARRSRHVSGILHEASDLLADRITAAAHRLSWDRQRFAVNRGIAAKQPYFLRLIRKSVRRRLPGARIHLATREGSYGAAWLALAALNSSGSNVHAHDSAGKPAKPRVRSTGGRKPASRVDDHRQLEQSPTEQRNPRTMDLDRRSVKALVDIMLTEETAVVPAIREASNSIAKATAWITAALKDGGRLFYLGAGTSGRLGILDAAECPPTFGTPPTRVQGIMAGDAKALGQSVEAAEDNADYGRQSVRARGVTRGDVLIGIAASGSTPFVLAGMSEAHRLGARIVFLTFNPRPPFAIAGNRFLEIAIETGPEAVTGSTRLKAGTATKIVLNMFSTIAMIKLGKVIENLMVDLDPTCEKLHDRAARIYMALENVDYGTARTRLDAAGWQLRKLLGR